MSERIDRRMRKDRPKSELVLRLPTDVIEDLQEIAPTLGFSGHIPLIRAYISQGLRQDLARLDQSPLQLLTECLRKQGLDDEAIADIIVESKLKVA
jgi:hypothetical protein